MAYNFSEMLTRPLFGIGHGRIGHDIFIADPVRNDSHEVSILSHTGITATAETFVVSFVGFHTT